jgi:hypothetical protein
LPFNSRKYTGLLTAVRIITRRANPVTIDPFKSARIFQTVWTEPCVTLPISICFAAFFANSLTVARKSSGTSSRKNASVAVIKRNLFVVTTAANIR